MKCDRLCKEPNRALPVLCWYSVSVLCWYQFRRLRGFKSMANLKTESEKSLPPKAHCVLKAQLTAPQQPWGWGIRVKRRDWKARRGAELTEEQVSS